VPFDCVERSNKLVRNILQIFDPFTIDLLQLTLKIALLALEVSDTLLKVVAVGFKGRVT
jgi:hypothetical protein